MALHILLEKYVVLLLQIVQLTIQLAGFSLASGIVRQRTTQLFMSCLLGCQRALRSQIVVELVDEGGMFVRQRSAALVLRSKSCHLCLGICQLRLELSDLRIVHLITFLLYLLIRESHFIAQILQLLVVVYGMLVLELENLVLAELQLHFVAVHLLGESVVRRHVLAQLILAKSQLALVHLLLRGEGRKVLLEEALGLRHSHGHSLQFEFVQLHFGALATHALCRAAGHASVL